MADQFSELPEFFAKFLAYDTYLQIKVYSININLLAADKVLVSLLLLFY
jgi:hypothetical protein